MSYQVTSSGGINVGNMNAITINTQQIGHISSGMMSDDLSEPSSPDSSSFDASDLLSSSVQDDVTAQLAAAGPIGVAAAAAIASSKKRKHPHHFETNPSKRKRQQTRLLRKLKATIDEYNTRIGQQAVVLCVTPGKLSQSINAFKVFGSQPLEGVMRNNKSMIVQELEQSLNEQAPPTQPDTSGLHELPPLNIDGIPTPVDKMTQAQLRNFIPEMLKYSTGRSKPGWGKEECRPHWWPDDLPCRTSGVTPAQRRRSGRSLGQKHCERLSKTATNTMAERISCMYSVRTTLAPPHTISPRHRLLQGPWCRRSTTPTERCPSYR